MRTLRRNQQKIKYALQIGEFPIFETDDDGAVKYDGETPLQTGKFEIAYSEPVPFLASISMSGGEAEAVEYGLSTADYSAVMITEKNAVPLTEGAIIWHTSKSEYKYGGEEISITVNNKPIKSKFVERTSADYIVMKKSPSLNFDKYILQAVNK